MVLSKIFSNTTAAKPCFIEYTKKIRKNKLRKITQTECLPMYPLFKDQKIHA